MILTVHQRFELDLPALWRELPPASVLACDDWRFEWVDELKVSVEHKEELLESLYYTGAFVMDKTVDGRSWVAVIDPVRGLVPALASIKTIELADEVFPDYHLLAVPALPLLGAVPWNAQSSETTLGGQPAIVVHQIGV
ncbi:hypothetical protein BH11ACT2_BH11ACT2_02600 [soil metagenome]